MFKIISEYKRKSSSEKQLKSIINDVYKNPSLEFDQQLFQIGKNGIFTVDNALYLFGKGLIDIPSPYEARLNKSAYSYFTDKRRKFTEMVLIRILLPAFVSIIASIFSTYFLL